MLITKKFGYSFKGALLIAGSVALLMSFFAGSQTALAVQSPVGCTADNSVVNVSSNVATAVEGDIITFTVSAGNPASGNGCDIENRTVTLTLPDGSNQVFGPADYPNPTAISDIGSEQYVADNADLNGGVWQATVSWNGTLKNVTDQNSSGNKGVSVLALVPLEIEKTVNTSFDREWSWTIEKSADQTQLTLGDNETTTVNYEVELSATSEDTNHEVSGTITITNPDNNPDATVTGVTDELDNSGSLVVDCTGDVNFAGFPHVLGGGETLTCTYSGDSDGTDTENTATVTTSGSIPGDEVTESVAFDTDPTTETDECVTVNDTNSVFPADTVICADDADKTIEYAVDFGPEGADVVIECGEGTHPNTADFLTNDTQTAGSDDENVNWTVECNLSCTYTQGYWKTHNDSFRGGAKADATWDLLPNGELTTFFLSGTTWFGVFNTPPKGNVYYILAHQYMAAELNVLSGASVPANVQDALDDAEAFFNATTPAQAKNVSKTVKAELTALAGLLGSYNEGAVGPGHCD